MDSHEDAIASKCQKCVSHSHCTCTAPATGNVKMKRVCFHTKRVCFSSANMGVVFSLGLKPEETVTISALFCILMDNLWYTKGFSIRDILHAMLEEEEIFVDVSDKTWYIYRLLSLRAPYLQAYRSTKGVS